MFQIYEIQFMIYNFIETSKEISDVLRRPYLSFRAEREICRKQNLQKEKETLLFTGICNSYHCLLCQSPCHSVFLFTIDY